MSTALTPSPSWPITAACPPPATNDPTWRAAASVMSGSANRDPARITALARCRCSASRWRISSSGSDRVEATVTIKPRRAAADITPAAIAAA